MSSSLSLAHSICLTGNATLGNVVFTHDNLREESVSATSSFLSFSPCLRVSVVNSDRAAQTVDHHLANPPALGCGSEVTCGSRRLDGFPARDPQPASVLVGESEDRMASLASHRLATYHRVLDHIPVTWLSSGIVR